MLRHQNPTIRITPKDEVIFTTRSAAFQERESLVGHYVLVAGLFDRITDQWDGTAQGNGLSGSYYLAEDGVSYSGGLSPGYKIADLELTSKTVSGNFWFAHDDQLKTDCRVFCLIECRVYQLKGV